ncbi:hypothetical protein Bpfe_029586, partial [Biomphalaria pfeifferi]
MFTRLYIDIPIFNRFTFPTVVLSQQLSGSTASQHPITELEPKTSLSKAERSNNWVTLQLATQTDCHRHKGLRGAAISKQPTCSGFFRHLTDHTGDDIVVRVIRPCYRSSRRVSQQNQTQQIRSTIALTCSQFDSQFLDQDFKDWRRQKEKKK